MVQKLRMAEDLVLPVDAVTQGIGILAKRRAGKSYTARRYVEQLHAAGQQVVIVDPKGDWWGIRSTADGKGPGLPIVILGGEHGDVPLEVGSGELVAKLAVEERVSMLLDLSAFRKREVATFMTAFLETFYRLKAREAFRTPVDLIVDEADAIMPQKPLPGEERMLGAGEDIVRRGGQRGIGIVLITQRSAVLNKNVLTQVQMLVALRTIAPQDLAAMKAWIDVHGTAEERDVLMGSLPSLPVGSAWFWSPGWPTEKGIFQLSKVLPIETFDSGATPKPGERRVQPKNLADVDLQALEKHMAATIERQKADDPKELRKRIAELEREKASLAKLPPVREAGPKQIVLDKDLARLEKALTRAEQLGTTLADKVIEGVRDVFENASLSLAKKLGQVLEPVAKIAGKIGEVVKDVPRASALEERHPVRGVIGTATFADRKPVHVLERVQSSAPRSENGDGRITPAASRILDAIAELNVLGVPQPARVQVAFLAGYTNLNSKGFMNAIGTLRSAGHIDYPSPGTLALTESGRGIAAAPERPRTSKEVQERVVGLLGGASERLLRPLIKEYPSSLAREQLAELAGYGNLNSKGFMNAIGRLRSLGFIDYPSPGHVQAMPVLFLEGR